jgi:hypothetical protein
MKHLLALCLVAGCGVSNTDVRGDTDPLGTPGEPGEPPPQMTFKTGPYQLVTRVDITAEAVLPAQAELVVATLRELSRNPARALISIADQAGVPAVALLYSLIPPPIKDRLEGWINEEIAKVQINGRPVTEYAGEIAAIAEFALTQFEVDSTLTIHGETATHRLTALDLTPTGIGVRLPIGGLAGDLLSQDTSVAVDPTPDDATTLVDDRDAGAMLLLGEQHFGLNYGEYAWQGVEALSHALFGAGVRASLGNAIDCPRLARAVSTRCVLGACVGHEAELTAICEGGLDAIVGIAHSRVAAMRLEAFHILSGEATMTDDDGDGIGDTITAGSWQAELNLGLGLRHAPATFEGGR